MTNLTDIMKLRVLLCMLHSEPKDQTVTIIAHTLHLEKYVVSRLLDSMEREGLICRSSKRKPILTDAGTNLAQRYAERIESSINHLIYEGVDIDSARNDALHWALYNSESSMEVIRASSELYRVKYLMREQRNFNGSALCRHMKDGTYSFPFIIYREHAVEGSNLSMANSGFLNPCALHIENGIGKVQLCAVEMLGRSQQNGALLSGRVKNLHYLELGSFYKAEVNGNFLSFPASCLQFVNIGSGVGQILHGSVYLKMECSPGTAHMPESTAIFTIMI